MNLVPKWSLASIVSSLFALLVHAPNVTNTSYSRSRGLRELEPDEQQLEAWEDSVPLGNAWWDFAKRENKNLFRERRSEGRGTHLKIRHFLEVDLVARLEDGQLEAYGIEEGSNIGPIRIAPYYFSKTAKVDYHDDTVTAFGKKFYEVRVRKRRENLHPSIFDRPQLDGSDNA